MLYRFVTYRFVMHRYGMCRFLMYHFVTYSTILYPHREIMYLEASLQRGKCGQKVVPECLIGEAEWSLAVLAEKGLTHRQEQTLFLRQRHSLI
jgi:hypothetical protein